MHIGLDLSSLQGPHRMRGIGYTLINLINSLPDNIKRQHEFVFYYDHTPGAVDPLEILDLSGLSYTSRQLTTPKRVTKTLPGKLRLLTRFLNSALSYNQARRGDPRIQDTADLDVFLQTDQMIGLPRGRFKKVFIAYDLIPYVMEWDYLWNYRTARERSLPRPAALRCSLRRRIYLGKLQANVQRADLVLAISEKTREDFLRYMPGQAAKFVVTPLGVDITKEVADAAPDMYRYIPSSWGYLRRPYVFDGTPYLLFVGGADKRRRLDHLVTAFNHLRGQGVNIKLVLAGDSMRGPRTISTEVIQQSLLDSSYIDDILFMGFVDDAQREWLYEHAQAFVFPSVYEGFGLPVLEAMARGCPVISYPNEASVEVAADHARYVSNSQELIDSITANLVLESEERQRLVTAAQKHARRYTYARTSEHIMNELLGGKVL